MATPTVIPAKQLYRAATKAELERALSKRESGWCIEDSTLYIKKEDGTLAPVVPAQDLVDVEKERAIAAEAAEAAARAEADANLKDYVDSNVLRIAPPESAGDGEVIMYRGTLV